MFKRPRPCLAPDDGTNAGGGGSATPPAPPAAPPNPPAAPPSKAERGQEKLLADQVARHDADLLTVKKKLGLDQPPPAAPAAPSSHKCSSPFCDGVGGCIDDVFAEEQQPKAAASA